MIKRNAQTIADIAEMAGVSKSTVSRALNDNPLISEETRQRIKAIAKEQNFQIWGPAKCLSLRKSNTIGYVTQSYHKQYTVADLFTLENLGGIAVGVAQKGYDLLVLHVNQHDENWAMRYLDSGRVDGFIVMTATHKKTHVKDLLAINAPFITWGVAHNPAYCTVTSDNFRGGYLATRHLIKLGRKKIAFLGGPVDEFEVVERYKGYVQALKEAGMKPDPNLTGYGDFCDTSGGEVITALLKNDPTFDAVFINSDMMAASALKQLHKLGRRVPDDIAVVGYDNLSIAEFTNPSLTTISQNVNLTGRLLAQNLIDYIETGVITNVTTPVELILRESA